MDLSSFPRTVTDFVNLILRYYPQPTPWRETARSYIDWLGDILAKAYSSMRYYAGHGFKKPFCEVLAWLIKRILVPEIRATGLFPFSVAMAVMASAGMHFSAKGNPVNESTVQVWFFAHCASCDIDSESGLANLFFTYWK